MERVFDLIHENGRPNIQLGYTKTTTTNPPTKESLKYTKKRRALEDRLNAKKEKDLWDL